MYRRKALKDCPRFDLLHLGYERIRSLSLHHNRRLITHLDLCMPPKLLSATGLPRTEAAPEGVFPAARRAASSSSRTLPPRGKSAENFWRARFLRNRALPHRRHRFVATKICATCFASSLPQDLSVQLMFELH